MEQIGEISDSSGYMPRLKIWKVKQRVCPKNHSSVPVAKLENMVILFVTENSCNSYMSGCIQIG